MTTPAYLTLARPFAEAWASADSATLFDQVQQAEAAPDESERKSWRDRVAQSLTRLTDATLGELILRAKSGQLAVVPHSAGRQIPTVDTWNTLARGEAFEDATEEEVALRNLRWVLESQLFSNFGFARPKLATPEAFDQALHAMAQAGQFGRFFHHDAKCRITGQTHNLVIQGWQPALLELNADSRMVPVTTDGPGRCLAQTTVAFPSGQLLVSDWFRLEAFSQADEARPTYHGAEDIATVQGRVLRTRLCAEQGFVHVFGGGERQLYQTEGQLRLGYTDDESAPTPEGQHRGSVNGDLRWTTVIDKAVLEGILIQSGLAPAAAAAQVAAYVADPENEVSQTTIEPGTYHLYFADHAATFGKQFASPDANLAGLEPICVISARPLRLTLATPGPSVPAATAPASAPRRSRRPG